LKKAGENFIRGCGENKKHPQAILFGFTGAFFFYPPRKRQFAPIKSFCGELEGRFLQKAPLKKIKKSKNQKNKNLKGPAFAYGCPCPLGSGV
jgi:hypothetical protein